MNNTSTWMVIAGIIAIAAISGLNVLFLTADAALTVQTPPFDLVHEPDPCRLVTCGPANIRAEAIGTNPLTGNLRCKCPNHPESFFEIAPWRKY